MCSRASLGAFAAILSNGSVVTWGKADCGGDSSAVKDELRNVQQIQASPNAFAAILCDGFVVTWGNADCGGDSRAVATAAQCSTSSGTCSRSKLPLACLLQSLAMAQWSFPQLLNTGHVQDTWSAFVADPYMGHTRM